MSMSDPLFFLSASRKIASKPANNVPLGFPVDVRNLDLHKDEESTFIDCLERYVQDKIGTERLSSRLGITYSTTFCPEIVMSEGTEGLFDSYIK